MKNNFKFNKIKKIFILLLFILLIFITFPWIFTNYDPNYINIDNKLQQVSIRHLLGTDILGRDVFSRILYGGRISIILAIIATIISLLIGLIIGIIAGYYGGIIDIVIITVTGLLQGLPSISIMIVIATFLGSNIYSLLLALTINSWIGFSKIVRSSVLKIKQENYIKILQMYRLNDLKLIVKHILPNVFSDVIILFTSKIVSSLLSIAGLSFLGIGIQPPTPDWGSMISDNRSFFVSRPLLIVAPGVCILIVSLGINYIGEFFREKLNENSLEEI